MESFKPAVTHCLGCAGETVAEGKIGHRDDRIADDDDGTLEDIDEFAHVARIVVLEQLVAGLLADALYFLSVLGGKFLQESDR